ncbi:hypothetical protein AGRA3207_004455 [Actinomadura graeca]|uniref:Uncharacterized protein n=1 Tax=Actinomadura graeca TaxID=2750812 RepID=A0ABX8QYQ2_9ACTN|nr:hypothetical protein [Actinomadura graeca]QXJ23314.1 hypothetical protein AGRA3207_004455 [Actinomadura graeca]
MAIARTATYTKTYVRTELIEMQINRILARSTRDRDYARRLLLGIERRWISEISVYGLDEAGTCHAELFVKVDWNRNTLHMSAGRDTVQVDAGWEDGIATEVDLALQKFEMVTRELGLSKVVHSRYVPGVDRAMANRELGFRSADPVQWRSGFYGTTMSVPELDEVTVGINLAGDG